MSTSATRDTPAKTGATDLRVLYGHCLSDPNHPAARMVRSIAVELEGMGDEVLVHQPEVAARGSAQKPAEPRPARPRKFQRFRNLLWFAKTLRHDRAAITADIAAIRAFAPEVVVARHDAYRGSLIRAARVCGVPVVVYADAPVAHETRHWSDDSSPAARRFHPPGLVELYESKHLAMSSAIVAVSEPGKRCLQRYGLKVPITVIRNGVDRAFLGPLPNAEEKLRLRREFGIGEPFLAGFVGTFKPFHGTALLAEVVRATAGWPDLSWIFVGDGPRKASLMSELGEAAGKVTDLGRQPPERLPQLYRMMDFAVAPYPPSEHEFHFCPLKILEAEASGAVVLASDRGDIPALLEGGRAGVVVAGETSHDWAMGLRSLMNDPAGTKEKSARARRFVENHHTWHTSACQLRNILHALSARRSDSQEPTVHSS
jgi:glycosyltransferase involved in cell wall biosynthesis